MAPTTAAGGAEGAECFPYRASASRMSALLVLAPPLRVGRLTCHTLGRKSSSVPPDRAQEFLMSFTAFRGWSGRSIAPIIDEVGGDTAAERGRLTDRERGILCLLAAGLTPREASMKLALSLETVRSHLRNAGRRLGARSTAHAMSLVIDGPRPTAIESAEALPGPTASKATQPQRTPPRALSRDTPSAARPRRPSDATRTVLVTDSRSD